MADDDWAGATFGPRPTTTTDDWTGATFATPRPPRQAAVNTPPEREAPGLIGAGLAGLWGDVQTGAARLVHGVGAPETAKAIEESAGESYARQAQRPLTDMDESWPRAIYEGVVSSLPSMAPVLAGAGTGMAVAGPIGALVGGTLGGMPQMFGSNLKRQMEENKVPLEQTQGAAAAGTALFQSALDSLVPGGAVAGTFGKVARKVLPTKLAENVVSRVATQVLAGGVTEGLTESAQQWLEILQANPQKAMDMPPETRKELRDNFIIGAAMGAFFGGFGGHGKAKPSTPPGVEPKTPEQYGPEDYAFPGPGEPPAGWDAATGYPAPGEPPDPSQRPYKDPGAQVQPEDLGIAPPPSGTTLPGPGPRDMVPDDLTATGGWIPNGQGQPTKVGEITPAPDGAPPPVPSGMGVVGREPTMGLPDPNLPWLPNKRGLPGELETQPDNTPAWAPNTNALNLPPGMPGQTGPQVFQAEQAKLRAAGMNQIQAAANARMAQARYETLGKQLGRDALSIYQEWNVQVQGPDMKMKLGDRVAQITSQGVPFKDAVLQAEAEIDQPFKQFEQAAYHGSPHKFDEFKLNKIGTGEGAQAFGWGLYFTNSEGIARHYRDRLSRAQDPEGSHYTFGGHEPQQVGDSARFTINGEPLSLHDNTVILSLRNGQYTPASLRKAYTDIIKRSEQVLKYPDSRAPETVKHAEVMLPYTKKQLANLNAFFAKYPPAENPNAIKGRLYTVDIPEDGEYLLWKQPLKDMPQAVQDKINMAYAEAVPSNLMLKFGMKNILPPSMTGAQIYDKLAQVLAVKSGNNKTHWQVGTKAASELLAKHGIPGIKYPAGLIAGNRKEGVNNYVIFDDKLAKITKYEQRQRGGPTPTPQGNITFQPDRSTVIRLFKTANESTYPHESAHLYLEQMIQYAPQNKQIAADLQSFMDWAGVTDPSQIERKHHEMFARGWEKFLRTGKAPSNALADLFRQFSEWLKKIYTSAKELDVAIPPYMEKVYARLVSTKENTPEVSTPTGVERAAPNTSQTFGQDKYDYDAEIKRTWDKANLYEKYALQAEELGQHSNALKWQAEAGKLKGYAKQLAQRHKTKTFEQAAPNTSDNVAPNWGRRTLNWMRDAFDPFSKVTGADQYRDLRNLMTGGTYAAEQAATKAKKLFDGLSLEHKNAANSFMETQGASPMTLPAAIRQEAVALKNYINGPLKRSLIDAGLLPESIVEKNKDSYLPRLYLKFMLEDGGAKGARLGRDYVKRRGDKDSVELLAMGEIKDPSVRTFYALFRPLRDLKVMEFLDQISQNRDWVIPQSLVDWNGRKVTPQWLKEEADSILADRAKPAAEPDPARRTQMQELAARMHQAAADGLAALSQADYDGKQYTKLPDTAEFGPLRGMVVHKQIADDITGTVNFVKPDNWFDKVFGDRQSTLTKIMSWWKLAKVPLNPPSQIRNIVSNMILLNLSGVPIHKVGGQMIAAARDMAADGKYYQIAKKYGVGHGTFSEQELYAITDAFKKLDYADQSGSMKTWRAIMNVAGKPIEKLKDWYQLSEVWGKVAKIKHAMETKTTEHPNGMSEAEAVREANKWLFDYSEVPQGVRRARQSPFGYPFMTFSYKVIPLMAEVARRHPTRFLPYVAMSAMVPMMTAAMNDIDQDDPEKLRKALPKALQKWDDMYLLPWKDDAGRWQFINIGYFMPWQMPKDFLMNAGKAGYKAATGDNREALSSAGEAIAGTNVLSNPFFNIVAGITTGVDPFTKKPIMDKRDPPREQVMDLLGYAWGLSAPSLLAPYGALGQAYQAATGSGMNRFGEPTTTPTQIGARALGLNVYPVMPEAQRGRNIQQMTRDIQDVKARMTYSLRDRSLTMEQRRNMVEDFRDEIKDRTEAMRKYVRESQPSPRLQAATARP